MKAGMNRVCKAIRSCNIFRARVAKGLQEDGASIVETAISLTIFSAVLLGVIQVSLALYSYHFVSEAAREASRWAMVRGNTCKANVNQAYCSPTDAKAAATPVDIQAYVNNLGFPFARNVTATTLWSTSNGTTPAVWTLCGTDIACKAPGSQVQVTVSYTYPIAIPFWRSTGIPMSSTSTMVIAQ